MRQIQFTSAYKPGDDIYYDVSIQNAESGAGDWFSTVTMNGVNSTEGSYSTQFVANCSVLHNDTIRVWLHCLFGSNSNSSTKLCFTVMAWKGL